MNKKKSITITGVISLFILAFPILTVFATKPTPINTVLQMMGSPVYEEQTFAGNNEIVRGTAPFMWGWTPTGMVGNIQGFAICEFIWNLHQDGYTGISVHEIASALVIVDGVPLTGSLTILITISKGEHGTWRIIKGTGELDNLHGRGVWESIDQTTFNPYDYAYTGNVHLDP
jgi:hypothetical protein